uniref:Inner membrane metabolite transport protein YhjE n=2 Tax=Mycobacterium riyadhense TaxID=486698 RepID=A0A653EYU8_9MYCO|nr:Inner membrane metabolite transport protein YhjE [Mycobacterium riyadhense]
MKPQQGRISFLGVTVGGTISISPSPAVTSMKRVAVACLVGSAIEFYDFLIYGTAAALVFPTVFFPHLSPAVATVASMGTFAAAFVSRPLGAGVFGYFGDRLGRKRTLVATLLVMALSTVTVGLVPSAATIGGAAPLILTVLRLLQGFALGGQWAGSALLSTESAPAAKRGLFGMFTLVGGGIALVLGSLTFLCVNYTVGESSPAFLQWGWRIPFLISAVLIGIALYVRLNINETPVFASEKITPKVPVVEVLRRQRRELILAAGSAMTCFGFVYLASTYLASYAHAHLGYSRGLILFDGVLGGLTCIVFGALAAALSDQVGRRRIVLIAWAVALPWSLVVMPLIDSGNPTLFAVAIVGMYAIASFGYGPAPAFLPELFATRWRYTGTALSVNLAGIIGGAVPPLIAGPLRVAYGSGAIGLMLVALVLSSLLCAYLLPETAGTALASS